MLNRDLLLDAMDGIPSEEIEKAGRFLGYAEHAGFRVHVRRKLVSTLLIAAVLISLITGACALGLFQLSGRTHNESFSLRFGPYDYEWPSEFVFEFEGPGECEEISLESVPEPGEHYWHYRWDTHLEGPEAYREDLDDYFPLCVVDVKYASQFVGDGALVLSRYRPSEIEQENWGEVQVFRFQARIADDELPEDYPVGNYFLLFHPGQGWIIAVRGYDTAENLESIARGITVKQTGKTVQKSDFENPYDMIDIGYG